MEKYSLAEKERIRHWIPQPCLAKLNVEYDMKDQKELIELQVNEG